MLRLATCCIAVLVLINARDSLANTPLSQALDYLSSQQDLFHRAFTIYDDYNSGNNHFYPSGWMGDIMLLGNVPSNSILDENCKDNPVEGLTCIRASYPLILSTHEARDGFAGIYWLHPDENWGELPGYDLTRYTNTMGRESVYLKFWVRGETGREAIYFHSGGIDKMSSEPRIYFFKDRFEIRECDGSRYDGLLRLEDNWEEYSFDLTRKDLSCVIGPFCWSAERNRNSTTTTFYIDNIRMEFGATGTELRLNEPHFIRSYLPSENIADALRNASYVYDNALALIAFLAVESMDGNRRAKIIADAFVYAQNHDRAFNDGRLRNAYSCGDLWQSQPGDITRLPGFWRMDSLRWVEDRYNAGSDCGNMAWAIIALLSYWEKCDGSNDSPYLESAIGLGNWIHGSSYSNEGGYTGGEEGWERSDLDTVGQTKTTWKSTEHNIDIYVAFTRLFLATQDLNWQIRADHANQFVKRMWNSNEQHFWAGTLPGTEDINDSLIPLDVHPWAILAYRDTCYSPGLKWAYDWCHVVTSESSPIQGFDFKANMHDSRYPPGIWWEGTAQMAVAYILLGQYEKAKRYISEIEKYGMERNPIGAVCACNPDSLATGIKKEFSKGDTIDWQYYRLPHIGATCWYIFAERNWNPYWSERIP